MSFRAITNGTAIQNLQENHYYPFGMEMEGTWLAQSGTENQYEYNGKELNEDFGLNLSDYGARWYDASVGRWSGQTHERGGVIYCNLHMFVGKTRWLR